MLPIKSRKEIDITSDDIVKLLNTKPGPFFKELYDKITIEIVNNRLENKKDNIEEFILKNYS